MNKNGKKSRSYVLSVMFGVVVSLVLASTGFSIFAGNKSSRANDPAPKYKVNENGQTYGVGIDSVSIETDPDLIAAVGVDGEEGYVKSEELYTDMPRNPEEAIAYMEQKEINKMRKQSNVRRINLYEEDGETVIDTFEIQDDPVEESFEMYYDVDDVPSASQMDLEINDLDTGNE